jgi:hypothetical protein
MPTAPDGTSQNSAPPISLGGVSYEQMAQTSPLEMRHQSVQRPTCEAVSMTFLCLAIALLVSQALAWSYSSAEELTSVLAKNEYTLVACKYRASWLAFVGNWR